MKSKKIMLLICMIICLMFTVSGVFANDITNETDVQVLQVTGNEVNDTNLQASSSLSTSAVYFNASASSDGDGSQSNPYKVYKADRINYGDTVYFADGEYTISEANSIYSSSKYPTTFIGSGNTILKSELSHRFDFTVTDNSYFVLKNLTMISVHINNHANLIAENVVFQDSVGFNPDNMPSLSYSYMSKVYDSSYGGVIICDTPSNKKTTLNLTNCDFKNNIALSGGVIAAYNTIANIQNCNFYNSTSSNFGGAIYSIKSNFKIIKSSFELTNSKYGGVIYSNSTDLYLKDSQFTKSQSSSFGGVIAAFSGKLDINNVVFTNYKSLDDAGGAIYSTGITLNVADSTFTGGHSDFGGAICNLKTNSTITNTKFINNYAEHYGGSIYNMYGNIVLSNNIFNKTQAETGGSIFNRFSDSFELSNNQFIDSKADEEGAIVFIDGDNVKVTEKGNTYDNTYVLLVYGNVYNIDFYESVPVIKFSPESIEVIPTFYDSRKYGYITPAKDQIQGGNCWAFSGIATLEACIKKATGIAYDFSEENVKNLMSEYSLFDLDAGVNNGGNLYMFIAYLASWFGPIYDEYDVYDDHSAISKIFDSLVHVQNVCILPERKNFYDNDEIKKAVLKYGAVSIGIDLAQNQGHAVTIVGWDDEFTSSDFLGNKALGAWIIKNSWGSDWGYNGYGYLSYQQPISYGYTFIFDDDRQYSNVYQYDFAGKSGFHSIPGGVVYIKNKFTAKNDEMLSAFSTYFDEPTNFTAHVYLNGKLVTSQNGSSDYKGYYTIPFDKEVNLKKGDTFEIVVKLFNDGSVYFPLCTAKSIDNIISGKGISFFSTDGSTWNDFYDSNTPGVACIKAFTHSKSLNNISIDVEQLDDASNPFGNINMYDLVSIELNLPTTYSVDGNNHPIDGLVEFTINGKSYFAEVADGKAVLNISFDKAGVYNVSLQYKSSRVVSNPINFQITVVTTPQANLEIEAKDVSKFYGGPEKYVATLTNDGKALSGVTVRLSVNGKEYTLKTDEKGQIIYDFDLPVGTYYASLVYGGKVASSKFTVLSTIVANDLTQEYGDSEISASFLNTDGNALTNAKVLFDVDIYGVNVKFNEKYDATTNAAGGASSKVSLPVSKYSVSVTNPVTGEKKQFMLDIMPVDTSCSISVTQSGSAVTLNAIIDTNATLTVMTRFENNKPHVNFLIGDKVYKAEANYTSINAENKIVAFASFTTNDLTKGDYTVSAIFSGDGNFKVSSDTKEFSVTENPYRLTSANYEGYYGTSGTILNLTDVNGVAVRGEVVYATVGNKVYNATTDKSGLARFQLDLDVGSYPVLFEYKGQTLMKYIFVKSTIDMDDLNGQYLDSKVEAIFKYYDYPYEKRLENKDVKFIVNGKEYNAVTDEYGYASADVDLPVGTHTVTAINPYTKEKKQSKITIFKTTPTLSISKSKRGDSVFITASFTQTSAVGNVIFTMGSNKYVTIIEGGQAILALIVLDEGSYDVYANYIGDPNFNNIMSETMNFTYEHTNYTITAPIVTKYYGGSEKFAVTLTNFNNPVSGETVTVTIADKVYNITTDSRGVATLNEKLNPGTYSVYCSFDDKTVFSEITVKSTITVTSSTEDVSYSKLSAEFRDTNGNLIKNTQVTFKVGNQEYKQTTSSEGIATFEPALDKGEYTVSAVNPVTGEIKDSKLVITKSTPTFDVSVVKKDGVYVLKVVLPKAATGVVEFVFDNGELYEIPLEGGECILDGIDPGEYQVKVTYNGNDAYNPVSKSTPFTVYRIASVLTASGVTTTYGTSKKIVMTLKDTRGNILAGSIITVKLNNKVYPAVISSEGDAEITVPASLGAKTYYAEITYAGEDNIDGITKTVKVVVKKATPKLTAAKKTFKVKDKTKKYVVTLKTNKNKVYKKQKITIKVNGKTYKATTNSKGQATFKLTKLTKKGAFTAVVTYSGNSNFNKVTKKVKITVK